MRVPGPLPARPGGPRFLVDAMLDRLARWLRVLGIDTTTDPALDDHQLVALAAEEDRVLLTRDRHLVTHLRPARSLLVSRDDPLDQLREVVDACGLRPPDRLFSRCLACNVPLERAAPEAVSLPPAVAGEHADRLWRCPGCEKVYWPGSHTRRMRAALDRALPGWLS